MTHLEQLREAVKRTNAVGLSHGGAESRSMRVEWCNGTMAYFEGISDDTAYTVVCGTTVLVCQPNQFEAVLNALEQSFY